MRTAIIPAPIQTPAQLSSLEDQARSYAHASRAKNTQRAYQQDWAAFSAFCQAQGVQSLPASPETVAVYLASMGGVLAAATIRRRLVTVGQAHKVAGHQSPTSSELVRSVLKGILNTHGTAQRKAAPVRAQNLRAAIEGTGSGLKDIRDRALLLLGFFGAFRRSELAGLMVEDLELSAEGVKVTLRVSKTDQAGQGRTIGITRRVGDGCPVAAVEAWLQASGIEAGPLFLQVNRWGQLGGQISGEAVADVLKEKAGAMGLDSAKVSGHSLRRGFVTEAYSQGAETPEIQAVTGHKSLQILTGYYQEANVYRNAAGRIRV